MPSARTITWLNFAKWFFERSCLSLKRRESDVSSAYPESPGTRRSSSDLNSKVINFELKWLHLFGTTHYPVFGLSLSARLINRTLVRNNSRQRFQTTAAETSRNKSRFLLQTQRERQKIYVVVWKLQILVSCAILKQLTRLWSPLNVNVVFCSFHMCFDQKIIHEQLTRFLDSVYTCLTSIQRLAVFWMCETLNGDLILWVVEIYSVSC